MVEFRILVPDINAYNMKYANFIVRVSFCMNVINIKPGEITY